MHLQIHWCRIIFLPIFSYPWSFNLLSGIFGGGSTHPRSLFLVLQHTLESEQSLSFLHGLGLLCPTPDPKLDSLGQTFSFPEIINKRVEYCVHGIEHTLRVWRESCCSCECSPFSPNLGHSGLNSRPDIIFRLILLWVSYWLPQRKTLWESKIHPHSDGLDGFVCFSLWSQKTLTCISGHKPSNVHISFTSYDARLIWPTGFG